MSRQDVDESQRRVVGHQVAAAFLAESALAHIRLLVGGEVLGTGGDPNGPGLPEAEGVDRATRPGPARTAMTIPHAFGVAVDLQLDGATETLAFV